MEPLSVGGLASGLDTNAIIDGLTDLERVKVTRVEQKQRDVELKLDAFNDLHTRISDFAEKAGQLDDIKAFNLYKSESSDEDHAGISGDENAIPGSFEIEIESLAAEWKVTSGAFSSIVDAFGFSGTIELSKNKEAIENDPSETTVEIEVDAGDTLKDLVAKINSAEGAGASASIISLGENDYRLVLSAVDEGTEGFYMKDVGAGNILDSGGLDILDYRQKVQSDFNLKLATLGAAQSTTLFSEIFTGIGTDTAIDAGDEIDISGTDANGNAVNGTFTIGAASTLQDLIGQVKTVFESQGSTADVALNSSGKIVITDSSGGLQEMTLDMSFTDVNGSGSELQLTPNGGQGQVVNNFSNVLNEGRSAFFRLDGLSISSETNQADQTVTGVTFELKKAELGEIIDLKLDRDIEGIKNKVQEFIEQYNAVLSFLDEKSKVKIENEDEDDPNKKASISSRGPFAGDSSIQRIKNELQNMMTSAIQELNGESRYTSLATLGIISNSTTSQLSIDDDKFEEAIQMDFEGVRRLFTTSGFSTNGNHTFGRASEDTETGVYEVDADNSQIAMANALRTGDVLISQNGNSKGLALDAPAGSGTGTFTFVRGIAGQISRYWDQVTDRFDGFMTQTKESIQNRIDTYKDRVEKMSLKVDAFREKLIRQFAGLEDAMSRLQNQSMAFQSQIGAL